VSARSRIAFASGVGGLAGATLLLSGRFDAGVVVALLFVGGARAAAPASVLDADRASSLPATRSLTSQMWLAPSWALIVAAGVVRAGSPALADARGANAAAGLAIGNGDPFAVAGAWFAVAAAVVAIASGPLLEDVPPSVQRLEIGAVLGQALLVVTLFAGPQIVEGLDAVPWVAGIAVAALVAWAARHIRVPYAPQVAFALAAVGLGATIAGGAP
jgi:hypothetical protein